MAYWNQCISWRYENMPIQIYWKFHLQKLKYFHIKNSNIFHISAQNIDCGYSLRGGSNENPQSMFLRRNKKINVYHCKPQFYYINVGFKGVKIIRHVFVMIFSQVKKYRYFYTCEKNITKSCAIFTIRFGICRYIVTHWCKWPLVWTT